MTARDLYRRLLRAYAWTLTICVALLVTLSGGATTEWGWLTESIGAWLRAGMLA